MNPTTTINLLPIANTIDATQDRLLIYTASFTDVQGISRNTLLGLSSQPLGLTDSQSPQNKVLDNTNTITVKDANLTLQDDGDTTKQAKFQLSGLTTATTRTYTLPDITDTLVTLTATQTLTNKTLTGATLTSPSITNASVTADVITGFTTSSNGTIYGMSVTGGILASAALLNTVNTAAIQTNAVAGANIATNALYLGQTKITSSGTTTSATFAAFSTPVSLTVTIPAGGRTLMLLGDGQFSGTVLNNGYSVAIMESGTVIGMKTWSQFVSNDFVPITVIGVVIAPSPGSHTYTLFGSATSGTLTMQGGVATANNQGPITLTAIVV